MVFTNIGNCPVSSLEYRCHTCGLGGMIEAMDQAVPKDGEEPVVAVMMPIVVDVIVPTRAIIQSY